MTIGHMRPLNMGYVSASPLNGLSLQKTEKATLKW